MYVFRPQKVGEILQNEQEKVRKMKQAPWKKVISLLTVLALCLSLTVLPALAADPTADTPFVNVSEDGGENYISLCDSRTFKASIPVDMTEAEAKAIADSVVWSLVYDEESDYIDTDLYPSHTNGGPLTEWKNRDGESPLFKDIKTEVSTQNGKVCLVLTFANNYYYDQYHDLPSNLRSYQTNGGLYLDLCGWFDLVVTKADSTELGRLDSAVKITPYDDFHTMREIYASMDELVDYAKKNTDLYVAKGSMGKSQGDNGLDKLDMPYLIIAKSKEAVDNWKSIKAEAESDPTALIEKIEDGSLGNYQVPVLYSNIHSNEVAAPDGVLNFAWLLVNTAASKEGTVDYKNLTGFTKEGEAKLAEQLGPKGVEGSIAVPDLVKDTATYLGFLKGQVVNGETGDGTAKDGPVSYYDVSVNVNLEKYYDVETVTVDVDELLDDVFFLIVPEENVEGRTYLTRTSSGGFDLNRDNSFQTQAETQNMTAFIAQWNPVCFTEFHGQHREFQVEPCDPPHEPNFEYDLLAEHLMAGGEALGIAAVANNAFFNSYSTPQRDLLTYTGNKNADGTDQVQWLDPWDDMSTSYTPQYSMLHGTVAYTVELPSHNDDSVALVVYGQLGQSKYVADNKDSFLLSQTKIFERGVTNANSNAYELVGQWFCDQYDVEGGEAATFRPEYDGEGQNGNFYPECYIIPLDGAHQKNLDAANQMLTYLTRNGVKVMFADKAFTYAGTEYPAGTAVVSMYQAKRSVANGVLYDGTVITGWPVLYSEGITAFNKTRGFDMATCAEPAAYETIAAACTEKAKWTVASDKVDTDQVILKNTSEAAIMAVNELLKAGKDVGLIISGDYVGSFLVSKADYARVSGKHLLTAAPVDGSAPEARSLDHAPVVYIAGKAGDNASGFVKSTLVSGSYDYNYDRQSLRLMGFETTDDPAKADLIIGAAALDDAALAAVKAGTPYIGYGSSAVRSAAKLFDEGALVREVTSGNAMDALGYVTYPSKSLITASYVSEGDYIMYGYGAGYFTAIPDAAQVLVRMDGSKELLEGFLPAGDGLKAFKDNSIQAISYREDGMNVVLFANTLTNKVHQRDEFTFVANAAFCAVSHDFKDVRYNAWYAGTVDAVVDAGLMGGTAPDAFNPDGAVSREMVATTLYRIAGSPEVEGDELDAFTDAADIHDWARDAMLWAVQEKVLEGGNGALRPRDTATRQELAAIFYRNAGSQKAEGDNLKDFADVDTIADWAKDAANWCAANGIIKGIENVDVHGSLSFSPKTTAVRAQLAAMLLRVQDAQ